MLKIIHHWWLGVASAVCWWGMLIALLAVWTAQGHPFYDWMSEHDRRNRTVLYISDIAASKNHKPIFISLSAAQGLFLVLALISERYLRHAGRLRPNNKRREKVLSCLAILMAIVGSIGIIFVAIFDTKNHRNTHTNLLVVFIVFVGASVVCSIIEYFYLDRHYKDYHYLRYSTFFKVAWFIVALAVAIGFGASSRNNINAAAILEWIIAFIYPLYALNVACDLAPARKRPKGYFFNQEYPLRPSSEMVAKDVPAGTFDEVTEIERAQARARK